MSDAPRAGTAVAPDVAVAVSSVPGRRVAQARDVDTTYVIVTQSLTKVYPGGRTAVDRLDLNVRHGEIFALLGPNGAGKTTTVGMLTGRVVPTSGRAFVNGVDVAADPGLAKASVGVVSQVNTLDRSLSVWENLYFHARYFGFRDRPAKDVADGLLEKFRLTGRAAAEIASLSGGLAKRVMLARAILSRPAVVFLDEPTAGLDPQSRLVLWEILGELRDEGQTILLTTHYMEEAERLASRVAIMESGELLALDTPERLRQSIGGGWVLVLKVEGDLDRLAGQLEPVPGLIEVQHSDGELRVRLEEADRAVAAVVAVAYREGYHLQSMSLEGASLETVFIELTGKELRE